MVSLWSPEFRGKVNQLEIVRVLHRRQDPNRHLMPE